MKIRHCGIEIIDVKRALKFYRILGFSLISKGKLNLPFYPPVHWFKLQAEEDIIELYTFSGNYKRICNKVYHIAFTVNNIDTTYRELKEAGATILGNIMQKKNVLLFFCEDLDGNLLEIVEDIK